jgi:hypothetical protein
VEDSPAQQAKKLSDERLTLEVCEERLRQLGLSSNEIDELGVTIDAIGDAIFDRYFAEFYD